MKFLDLTLASPAANLAYDEVLLDSCEQSGSEEILRFWEPVEYFVVLGYANRVASEVNVAECSRRKIPIFRRCSGGGTIVQGPGCVNYSLILDFSKQPSLATITETNRQIMERNRDIFRKLLGVEVEVKGHTDLTLHGVKFSGNAQRRRKTHLLFHGTFLLNFEIGLIKFFLKMPSLQPGYRENRSHEKFLTNIDCSGKDVKSALQAGWGADKLLNEVPAVTEEALKKYQNAEWNFRF
ncbi:MAG: lipoate--protein ligase family protein [Verrucomicrobiota bacterium]